MSDDQICWSSCAECVESLSQRGSGAVLMERRHEEGQTDKQGLYQRKRSDDSRIARQLLTLNSSKAEEIKAYIANALNTTLIRLAQITFMATTTTITTKAVGRSCEGKVNLIQQQSKRLSALSRIVSPRLRNACEMRISTCSNRISSRIFLPLLQTDVRINIKTFSFVRLLRVKSGDISVQEMLVRRACSAKWYLLALEF